MKIIGRLSALMILPIFGGIALLIAGSATGNALLSQIGKILLCGGVPGVMVILVIVGLVISIKEINSDTPTVAEKSDGRSPDEQTADGAERLDPSGADAGESTELTAIDNAIDINSAASCNNTDVEQEVKSAAPSPIETKKPTKSMARTWIFFGFLMSAFVLTLVFAFFKIFIGAIVCAAVFALTIATAILIRVIGERASLEFDITTSNYIEIANGIVKTCELSSVSRSRTTFKVTVTVNNSEYTAYSVDSYAPNDPVTVAIRSKRRASIIKDE